MSRRSYLEEVEDLLSRRNAREYDEDRIIRLVVSLARAVAEEVVDVRMCGFREDRRGHPMIRYRPDRGREERGQPMIQKK